MNSENTLNLLWDGPFRLVDFISGQDRYNKKYRCSGVYLHVVNFPNGIEKLAYVGKANNLFIRQQQHYAHILGGLYMIPEEFRSTNMKWEPNWEIRHTANIMTKIEDFMKLVKDGYQYAMERKVYLCIKDWNYSTREVERSLLYKLKPYGTKIGTKSEPNNLLNINHIHPDSNNWETIK